MTGVKYTYITHKTLNDINKNSEQTWTNNLKH